MLVVAALLTLGSLVTSVFSQRAKYQQIVDIVNASGVGWRAALLPDINYDDPESLRSRVGSLKDINNQLFAAADAKRGIRRAPRRLQTTAEYPASLDLRQLYPGCASISTIRNQRFCGCCWAFATMNSLSDRYCIAKAKAGINEQRFFSVEDVLECCSTCNAGTGNGCKGGIPYYAVQYAVDTGVVTGEMIAYNRFCKPYYQEIIRDRSGIAPACNATCSNSLYPIAYANDKMKARSVVFGRGEAEMIAALNSEGSISAIMDVYNDFYNYISGIYSYVTGYYVGAHAVKVVGYGEENGVKFWRIANTWGATWGEAGFFRIRRGTDECRIESNYFCSASI
jgi:hypothetical protein